MDQWIAFAATIVISRQHFAAAGALHSQHRVERLGPSRDPVAPPRFEPNRVISITAVAIFKGATGTERLSLPDLGRC